MSYTPDFQDPDDLLLVSRYLNGRGPWLKPARQVPYAHVLYAAAVRGHTPAAVVARLASLGYTDVQHSGVPWPDSIGMEDASLVKREGPDRYTRQWVDVGEPVSLREVLQAAEHAGRAPADVARRLTALGYRLGGSGPLPATSNPRDVMLIRTDPGGDGSWLDWGDEVPAAHVLEAAQYLACSPHAAAERLAALGLRLPYTPEPDDERILRFGETYRAHYPGRYESAPLGHVLAVARETGRRPADIVARLKVLGAGEPGGSVPESPDEDDFVILSENLDGRAPWLRRNTVVGLRMEHILRASLATGRGPASIAARLTELGHWLHENAKLPESADEADIRLLETVDRSYRDEVYLEHVLRSASLTGRSPADVASRLTELGHELPEEVEYPDVRGALAAS
ncbi:wHTH domain-containing protein [Streptomyces pratensis]|uniref:wHTH domain-containing protein n=1 Tax=Streptomyces pratensis TaxID=1169025 RepID=UPI00363DE3CF